MTPSDRLRTRGSSSRAARLLRLPTLLMVLLAGACKPAPDSSPQGAADPQLSPRQQRQARRAATNQPVRDLQFALDDLGRLVPEPNPRLRPRPVSRPSASVSNWIFHVLLEGAATGADGQESAEEVRRTFARYAGAENVEQTREPDVLELSGLALQAGSRDPFLRYLGVRYRPASQTFDDGRQRAMELVGLVEDMEQSGHHAYARFRVALAANRTARAMDRRGDRGGLATVVMKNLEDLARDTHAPASLVYACTWEWLRFADAKNSWAPWVLSDLEGLLDEHWSGTADWHYIKAYGARERAWLARGSDTADKVTEQGWRDFERHLAVAETQVKAAWELDPSREGIAILGLGIELGQGRGIEVAQRWFQRAMALNPRSYSACKSMSLYLEPRWHGSEEACLAFSRSCVTNTSWGGEVPLILPRTHASMAAFNGLTEDPRYWHRPFVWADGLSGFEKFFRLNPNHAEEQKIRHEYARYAFRCGSYPEFLEQVARLHQGTNFSYFGGAAKFAAMLERARR